MNQLYNRIGIETIPIVPKKSEEDMIEETDETILRRYMEIREQKNIDYRILIG